MELNQISVAEPTNDNTTRDLLNMVDLNILEESTQLPQHRNLSILEAGPQVSQDINMGNFEILDEGPRVCPVCSREIRFYFINYNEKIEMCENLECDYPFGYESLKILREENGVQSVEVKSIMAKGSRSTPCSQGSSQAWSEVDKLCNAFEPENTPSVDVNKFKTRLSHKKSESDRRKKELLENVEKIKQMTKSMNEMKNETKCIIKNEKWIKNLQYLQGLSGFNLLKPAELKKIKEKVEPYENSEIKIDIDKSNLSNIKIEVNRTNAPNTKKV